MTDLWLYVPGLIAAGALVVVAMVLYAVRLHDEAIELDAFADRLELGEAA